ncbi:TetR/AcrR family transcriptional regulator [Rothia sp. AR01]|uniref:TetR/AcrR family transcriptional regulator n=1 Tax=Rothia santali TaxID=2949643 RepID=A0A9X2HGE4_9MICC|nr:TetR/AcrR family transcriptional regulator [Rothia santali]MCP3425236.1 TetR/AcrR family transcriptional regulator [Rothia santali]
MAEPKLRKDAALNRERLLTAGREVFAQRGLDATLNDVAHHAGVGVGTAYRRFANKEELIDAILAQQVEELEAILAEALAHPDPWEGLVLYLERSLAIQAKDRGMAQVLSGQFAQPQKYDWGRDRLAPLVNQVADRAREAGLLREDVTGTDLILLQVALTAIASTAQDGPPPDERDDIGQLYRRYLWMLLDGLRPYRDKATALPVPPLTTAQTHLLLGSVSTHPRD